MKYDEIYQPKAWSRDKVNVLLSLDPDRLDYNNPRVHRTDHDFAVAWSKMYGKGRVFYSTLGHTEEAWNDPDIRKMYFEAIRWALGMTDGSTASHPRPIFRDSKLTEAHRCTLARAGRNYAEKTFTACYESERVCFVGRVGRCLPFARQHVPRRWLRKWIRGRRASPITPSASSPARSTSARAQP